MTPTSNQAASGTHTPRRVQTPASGPPPPRVNPQKASELNDVQKGDLARLWPSHASELLDSSSSVAAAALCPPRPNSSGGDGDGLSLDDETYSFIVRLHSFFVSAVCAAASLVCGRDSAQDDTSMQGGGSASGCSNNIAGRTYDSISFLFHPRSTHPRLSEGRQVVTFDYPTFASELHRHETQAGLTQTREHQFRNSYGAFLHHFPERALTAAGCAIGLTCATLQRRTNPIRLGVNNSHGNQNQQQQLNQSLDRTFYQIRFTSFTEVVRMVDVKTSMAYKFVTLKGHVTKARPKRLRVVTSDFQCSKCGEQFHHRFADGRYNIPERCVGLKCRSRTFALLRPTARYVDYQQLKLQESQDETTIDAGRTPRQMEVELTNDLVDCCNAGDIVRVSGIIRAVNSAVAAGKTGKRALETSTYKLYLVGNSIVNATADSRDENKKGGKGGSKSRSRKGGASASASSVTFSVEQLRSITELAHADHRKFDMVTRMAFPFDLLVRSLCPSIIGHDMVKAGILLGLLGGTPPLASGLESRTNANTIRSNSHVLVVGDPGMGKSQMLLAASQIASRSVYVGGNTASTTGLTVSLTKESGGGGEVGIEAGALVLADQGVCCIDEFDKMAKTNQDGLLEAMEQQQISIAKAGVVASLPARCSVIAAANPKHGNYNMGKTVAENLNMATPLLSRFDLVFILRDRADQDQDRMVSSNIMNLYRQHGGGTARSSAAHDELCSQMDEEEEASLVGEDGRIPMKKRLLWVTRFQKEPLPADLVRDYIAYAREYCKPKLTQSAAAVLKDYFMGLRYPTDGSNRNDSVPITTRQLEALIRLSQARAKACLREYVLEEDARDVVELMTQSVDQVHMDEQGNIDRTRGGAGGKSNRKIKKEFEKELRALSGREVTMDDLRRIASKVDCPLSESRGMIDDLRSDNVIMKKSNGNYQVV